MSDSASDEGAGKGLRQTFGWPGSKDRDSSGGKGRSNRSRVLGCRKYNIPRKTNEKKDRSIIQGTYRVDEKARKGGICRKAFKSGHPRESPGKAENWKGPGRDLIQERRQRTLVTGGKRTPLHLVSQLC